MVSGVLSHDSASTNKVCVFYRLGITEYDKAIKIQKMLWAQRLAGNPTDYLLLLEHPASITLGKAAKLENILVDKKCLARNGISLFFTDRGGDVTYHGPGQLVAYPIIDLNQRGRDIHRYVRSLEEVVIRTLADLSIEGRRDRENVGVWVGDEKIAAIGVSIKKWITMHGLALNVNTDIKHFSLINPCGIHGGKVTTISRLLGYKVPVKEIGERLVVHFSKIFDTDIETRLMDLRRMPL